MSGHLPWMDNLANEEYVEAQKKGFMSDVKSFVHRCFGDKEAPGMCLDVYELTLFPCEQSKKGGYFIEIWLNIISPAHM